MTFWNRRTMSLNLKFSVTLWSFSAMVIRSFIAMIDTIGYEIICGLSRWVDEVYSEH